jgi:class 3 adenylate cyclase
MKSIKLFALLVGQCLLALQSTFAQHPVEIIKGGQSLVGTSLEYFVDTTKELGINELDGKSFVPGTTDILNLGNTVDPVWMRFSVHSKTEKQVYLEVSAPLLSVLEVYQKDESSSKLLFTGGSTLPFIKRPIKTENFIINVHLNDTGYTTLYLKGQSVYPFQVPITVSSKDKMVENNQLHYLFWGIYMGVMLFAFLYNFFIFLSVRERIYLYYLLYIASSVLFYLGLEGFGFQFIWSNSPGLNPMVPVFVSVTNIVITLFAFRLLHIDKQQKGLYYIGWGFIGLFVFLSILNMAGVFLVALMLSQMFSLLICIYFITAGIISLRRGVPTAKYFLIAWFAFLSLVIVFILALNNVVPSNFFTTHGIFMGHMTEVLLLSFALADRINTLKIENENKQKKIILQLEENQQLQTKVNRELEQKVAERTAEVVAQKDRSEKLLLNILPAKIADELMQTGFSLPKQFNNVTVIFTDFENFTGISEKLTPNELVEEINKNFTQMDQIIEKHGLEKIKTIGDAYLAVCGLPNETEDHALRVVNAALEIRTYMLQQDNKFGIRIGVHSGQVVAGIVGVKKFAYDIWGDTVNTASRLENKCEVGKVNISQATYELIADKFNCTYRGEIEAKGKGALKMYFVEPQ